jgi:hypothetical protein
LTKICYRYPTFYGFDYQPDGVMVLKGENISREGELADVEEPSFISQEVHARFPLTHVEAGDLIISVRGEVGKVGFITPKHAGANINANTIRIAFHDSIKGTEFEPEFIWLYLNSDIGQSLIRQFIAGGVQETITAPELLQVRIPKLSPIKQRELLAAMKTARSTRQQKQAEADALLAGFDGYLLTQLGLTAPASDARQVFAVRLGQLRDTGRLNADYFHPERILAIRAMEKNRKTMRVERLRDIADFVRDAVPAETSENYLGLANVQSNTGELVESNEEDGEGLCFRYAPQDVLFARLRPYLNKVHRAEKAGVCSTEFHVIRIHPAAKPQDEIRADYLATVLRSSLVLAQTRHMMTGNTHPRLANEDVVNLIVPIPDPKIQAIIAAEVTRRRAEARRLRSSAGAEWAAAKARFEQELLGEGTKP